MFADRSRMKEKLTDTNCFAFGKAIDQVAQAYNIDHALIREKIKEAFQKAYNAEINPENTLVIEDGPNQSLLLFEELKVVDTVANPHLEITLAKVNQTDSKITLGSTFKKPLLVSNFSYFAIQKVSQVIKHFINVSESEKIYSEFIPKKHTILSGTIENFEHRYLSVNIGKVFAFIPKEEQVLSERLRMGDHIKFYVKEVFLNHHFGQVMGSRKSTDFLAKLFALEVPEVGSGIIKIKKIVREPGLRAKVALLCSDDSIDPVGSCIGRGGNRIKSISRELRGEKIDIFLWDDDDQQLIINATSPSKVVNITFLPDKTVRLVVLQVQYPVAIGRAGAAVRLLADLTGYEVDIQPFETYIETVDQLLLNGNLSYIDLVKLEVAPQLLDKCIDPSKTAE